jgi:hypothetical protein
MFATRLCFRSRVLQDLYASLPNKVGFDIRLP